MTRREVIQRAMDGHITWLQAATICRVTPRHMARLRERYERFGIEGLRDGRTGKRQPVRVPQAEVEAMCRLKRDVYADFSVRHFHEFLVEKHRWRLGYTWTKDTLQARGLAERAAARGKYRRKRERRPMRGMLMHLDASTHEWIKGLPKADLVVMLDDADGRILFARFVDQEGTRSTLEAMRHVLRRWGRFCELYTDRGSHFCRTGKAAEGPDAEQHGQVSRVCKALGIRQILARSPEARGRSERAFGTLQGRLPQELRLARVTDYAAANDYLDHHFVARFNRRFAVEPAEPESAFVTLTGLDIELLLSIQHERVVNKDNTVLFERMALQLPSTKHRLHFARCPVLVHELLDGRLAVTYQGRLVARFRRDGTLAATRARAA